MRQGRLARYSRFLAPCLAKESVTGQTFSTDGVEYSVDRLWELAEKLPVKTVELDEYRDQLEDRVWREGSEKVSPLDIDEKSKHWKRMKEADLSFPILVAPDGEIMDGYHRLLKAHVEGNKKIKIKQFEKWPEQAEV